MKCWSASYKICTTFVPLSTKSEETILQAFLVETLSISPAGDEGSVTRRGLKIHTYFFLKSMRSLPGIEPEFICVVVQCAKYNFTHRDISHNFWK